MSDPRLAPAVTPSSTPPSEEPGADIPLWVVVGSVAVMIVGLGLVAWVLLHGMHGGKKPAGPSYPSAWDPRLVPYVKVVERERGLAFLHPVTVRFLPDAQFEKSVRVDASELDADDRRSMERATGLFRAFGLLSGKVDLFSASNDVSGSGTLAYYSFEDKRITIRGNKLSPAVKPTLVHELTHALQDQHFAVGDRLATLAKKDQHSSSSEFSVLHAIVEGDAERTASAYLASLSPARRAAISANGEGREKRARDAYAKVPQVIVTLFSAPYTLGQALVQAVAEDGGNAAIDELIRDTPTHDAALLDPFRVLLADQDPRTPPKPALDPGDKSFDDGEFGAVMWYLTLAQRLPSRDALTTVDGWGGDAYVAYEHDGVTCARAAYRGQESADTDRMLGALQQWIAAVPGTPASVERDGDLVRFQSCDPGTEGTVTKQVSERAVALAVSRTNLGITILHAGAPDKYARCISDRLIHAYSIAQLSDPRFGQKDPTVKARIFRMAAGCRS